MRHGLSLVKGIVSVSFIVLFLYSGTSLCAQGLKISDFILFGGSANYPATGQTLCKSPGAGVQLGSASVVNGGAIGSYRLVQSTGNIVVNGNIYSGSTVSLANGNTVTGRITAANSQNLITTILSVGSNTNIGGNIDVNGSVVIQSGTVSGKVTYVSSYSGPAPAGGKVKGTPALPVLPALPPVTSFPTAGTSDITASRTITPGAYGKLLLSGGKTLTLSGPGVYVFKSINNSGTTNNFVFDFKNTTTGNFFIYIYGDVNLGKVQASMINGGAASRIFSETHGTGSTNSDVSVAWNIDNGSSGANTTKWLGTVWSPFAAINIGSGSGSSEITGALWSGTQVNVQKGVTLNFAPFNPCIEPGANAGPDKPIDFGGITVLEGSSATPDVSYNWQALNGGSISTSANTASITVAAAGTYVLTVTAGAGCVSTDTAIVTSKVNDIIGSELRSLYDNGDSSQAASPFFIISNDSVFIEIIVRENKYTEALALLQTAPYGLTNVISNGISNFIITGKFPIANLPKLNLLPDLINYCRPLYLPIGGAGIANTQGDAALRTDFLRNGFNLNGDSIKVGVISDSYNTLPGNPANVDVVNGDLPGAGNTAYPQPVQVLQDYPFGARTDEGRAMLQIVHDIAPAAKLAFRTGFISPGDMAEGIRQLKQNECDIIVDDVTFITEPFFQDGVVAQAVNEVSNQGVTYFTSAGNFAGKSYQSVFTPVTAPASLTGQAHNFSNGDIYQSITFTPGDYIIVLQWQDAIYSLGQTQTGGTKNDLDIYLTANNAVTLYGFNRNNIGGDPLEIMPFKITTTTTTNILITRPTGTGNIPFKYVIFKGAPTVNEYFPGASTITGHGNAENAFTIGAVRYTKTPGFGVLLPEAESFSSLGGTVVNNVERAKPDFMAPDGINTSVSLGSVDLENDGLPNFFGTSAAAPHAAAVAALIKQARKRYYNGENYSNTELKALLKSTSLDMGTPGFDYLTGNGFIQADKAIQSFAAATPSLIRLVVPDSTKVGAQPFTVTVKGNYLSDDTRILFRKDTITSVYVNDSTITAQIPAFIGNPTIEAYTPSITPAGTDGGLSNGITFYDIVKKNIKVVADNKTIRYGEKLPAFTATITVDNVPLPDAGLTIEEIGLTRLTFSTPATSFSDANRYVITASRSFDPANATDQGLNELYNYSFTNGFLDILKLPVKVVPADTTITYGNYVGKFRFNYEFDASNMENPLVMQQLIGAYHNTYLPGNALAVLNGGDSLATEAFSNLTALTSLRAIQNSRSFTIQNNKLVPATDPNAFGLQYLVDIAAQSLTDYTIDPAVSVFRNVYAGLNGKALLSATALANNTGKVNVNGSLVQLVNGSLVQMVNTADGPKVPLLNGSLIMLVNGSLVQLVNGIPVAVPDSPPILMINGGLVQLVNGGFQPLANGSLVQLVNGSLIQMVNGSLVQLVNGGLVQLVNGQYEAIPNSGLVQLVNGSLLQFVNGQYQPVPNGSLVQLINGSLIQLVNGSLIQLVNGNGAVTAPIINGGLVQLVNGSLVQLVNGIATPIPNGSLIQLVNGSLVQLVNGGLIQLVNGSLIQLVNGGLVQLVNGEAIPVPDNQFVQLTNGSLIQMVNGGLVQLVNGALQPASEEVFTLLNATGSSSSASGTNAAVIIDEADVDFEYNWIGPMMGINMITGLQAGQHRLIPGLLKNNNLDISYGIGNVSILPAPLVIAAKDSSKVYGKSMVLDSTAFTITGGELMPGDSIASVSFSSEGLPASANAGTYPILPSAAKGKTGTVISNYSILYTPGTFTVSKAPLLITARNATKVYGDPNPVFVAAYSEFVNGQSFTTSGISGAPSFSTSATASSIIGSYPILVSAGTLSSVNYTFTFRNGDSVLVITKAPLSIKADDKVIYKGSALPTFTSTITGIKNNDVLKLSYSLDPSYCGNAGVYAIIPAISLFDKKNNYTITLTNGSLYVNPYGNGAKKLRPYLECVEEIANPAPGQFRYIAHFYCLNDNTTTLYIPAGADNSITSLGAFNGTQLPVVFKPGKTSFDIPFDGKTLKWILVTYETTKKTSTTTQASSSSGRCSYTTTNTMTRGVVASTTTESQEQDIKLTATGVYPVPARNSVKVFVENGTIDVKSIRLIDNNGKERMVSINGSTGNSVELNLSHVSDGVYFIRLKTKEQGYKVFRILKMQ